MDAREITTGLGGRWHGSYGAAKCPSHDDRSPSLTVREGEIAPLLYCQAGCGQAEVIDALKARGLWTEGEGARPRELSRRRESVDRDRRDRERRVANALAMWKASQPATDTLVDIYLRARGITVAPPPSLRFAPSLRHGPTGLDMPAMIAAVQSADRRVVGVQRTYLTADGMRKAQVSAPRMSLGSLTGGAMRLAAAGPHLGLTEGVEDGLAVVQMHQIPVWAVLGGGGLRTVVLPDIVETVTIFGDADDAGQAFAERAAEAHHADGRKVFIAYPEGGAKDFNQHLLEKEAAA